MGSQERVAILDDYQGVALTSADWSLLKDGVKIDVYRDTISDLDALAERLQPYRIICTMRERTKFLAPLLDRLPNLKLLSTTGPYNASIDVAHAKEKGIVVTGTSGKGRSTLEHIWALILATCRYVAIEHRNVVECNPKWQTHVPLALYYRTLGLVGVGSLGASTAKIAKVFGLRVIGWSPHLTPERAEAAGVEFIATKEELFKQSDIVSVHMVLSESTYGMITKADLSLMKPTAFFINTSRGPLVDEEALVEILSQRKIAGAGLDVFDIEPLPLNHRLRDLGNVTLTPHEGYVSDHNYEAFWGDTVANIAAFLDGKPPVLELRVRK